MRSFRVLVGGLPEPLREVVLQTIARHGDLDLVGISARPSDLLRDAGGLAADIVLVEAEGGHLPGIASHLVDQYPEVRVLAIRPDLHGALLYALAPRVTEIAGSSPDDLVAALRAACAEEPDAP